MRLLTIANLYYLLALFVVFLVGGLVSFFILKSIINNEFNRKLYAEKEQLVYELHNYDDLKESYSLNIGDIIKVTETQKDTTIAPILRDTVMFDQYEKSILPFRSLTFSDRFNGKTHIVSITKSLLPNQDLIRGIAEIMILTFVLIMISLIALNSTISNRLWNPFYRLLDQIKKFNLYKPDAINLPRSNVHEFEEMHDVLKGMIEKSRRDYENLKEYTENTSHEIQTPLAIIRNKSEILLQENLTRPQLEEVGKIYEAATRLSRLKEGLSTLTKIENNQFHEAEPIDIKEFILQKLDHFDDLIRIKNIQLDTAFHAQPIVVLNNDLAYMLFTNLISNSIKHNTEGGKINLVLKENEFAISNTGSEPPVGTRLLFERFRKAPGKTDSIGLGLALVKKIVDTYKMKIRYDYENGWHKVILNF